MTASDDTRVRWPAGAVEGIGLDDASVQYLVEVGFARGDGPFVWLAPPVVGELPILLDVFADEPRVFPTRGDRALASTMRVLGRDAGENPIVLLRDGRVMLFAVAEGEIEDVNGSLPQLAACDALARGWVASHGTDETALLEELARVDPIAGGDTFWPSRIGALREGHARVTAGPRLGLWQRLLERFGAGSRP